jgi:hypothetical protein
VFQQQKEVELQEPAVEVVEVLKRPQEVLNIQMHHNQQLEVMEAVEPLLLLIK